MVSRPASDAANEQKLERLIGHKNGCPYLFFEQGECNCGDSAAYDDEGITPIETAPLLGRDRDAAQVDKSSVYIFDSYALEPVFHRYGKIDRDKDADVTACGQVMWTITDGTQYAANLPRFHAERFARPCGRCFRDV